MKSKGIHVYDSDLNLLRLVLVNMPSAYIKDLHWRILYIDGIIKEGNEIISDILDSEINSQKHGKYLSWYDLNSYSVAFDDLWDILIVGSKEVDTTVSRQM